MRMPGVESPGTLRGAGNREVSPEAMDLPQLRAEVTWLKLACGIEESTAYFAKDVL